MVQICMGKRKGRWRSLLLGWGLAFLAMVGNGWSQPGRLDEIVGKTEDGGKKPASFNIIYSQDLEHHRNRQIPFEYTTDLWNPDWSYPGWRDGDNRWPSWFANHIKDSIVLDPLTGSVAMKFNFTDTVVGGYSGESPYRGGDYWKVNIGAEPKEMYLSYNVFFRPGFDFAMGGKLPATNGGSPLNKATQQNCVRPGEGEGYSTAIMFQPYGGLAFYCFYQNQNRDEWGETDFWDTYQPEGLDYDNGRFKFDVSEPRWYNITIRVVINSFTGGVPNSDGIMEGFIDGKLVESKSGMYLLTASDIDKGVNQISLGHFFGGNTSIWKPVRKEWTLLDDFVCFTYGDDMNVPRGNVVSPPGRVLELPNMKTQHHEPEVDNSPPSVPGGLKTSNVTGTFIDLEWGASIDNVGVAGYRVYKQGVEVTTTSTRTCRVAGLEPNSPYSFSVSAYDKAGNESGRSTELYVSTTDLDITPPTVPQNLLATDSTENSITLSWDASTDDAEMGGYMIYSVEEPEDRWHGTTPYTFFDLRGLNHSSQYDVYIVAVDASVNMSAPSEMLRVRTRAPDVDPPSPPGNLKSTLVSQTSISIEWTPSIDNVGVTGYSIIVNGFARGESTGNNYTLTGLSPGISYAIRVVAYDHALNESLPSNEIVETTKSQGLVVASLPEVQIVEFLSTLSPNVAAAVSQMETHGHTNLQNYGLLVTKRDTNNIVEYEDRVIYADQEFSEVGHDKRVSRGLELLYDFSHGNGMRVYDRSDRDDPINLDIINPLGTSWLPGQGLKVDGNTIIKSEAIPKELIASLKSTNELTLETWIRPSEVSQSGPARIMGLSLDNNNRAFMLGQSGNQAFFNFASRLNTTSSTENGFPEILTEENHTVPGLYHVVYKRGSGGEESIFIDGDKVYSGRRDGDFSSFSDNYELVFANELTGERPWRGIFYLAAIYSRALSDEEILRNYNAGPGEINYTTSLFVDENTSYEVTPFAKTDQGYVLGEMKELILENVLSDYYNDSLYMVLYPNPNSGDFRMHIECSLSNSGPAYLRISDMMGQIVYVQNLELGDLCSNADEPLDSFSGGEATNSIELSFSLSSFLEDGVYAVMLIVGDRAVTRRLLVH